jgi:uncharacterized protein with NRDE domain
MCTLSYVPSKKGVIITANRDENPLRSAKKLSSYHSKKNDEYLIAREPLKGGTNMAVGRNSRVSVLLNGAFEPHAMRADFGMSRGLMLLESLEFDNLFRFCEKFEFNAIEPFTLVDFSDEIRQVVWDGQKIHQSTFDPKSAKIWASHQLYSEKVVEKRKQWFANFLDAETPDANALEYFHKNAGDGDSENDLVMDRNGLVQTVSITQVESNGLKKFIHHWDMIDGQRSDYKFE